MGWIDRMNAMIAYIESHLDDNIDDQEMARVAAVPLSLLQRMMPIIANITLSDYIRSRRLTLAAIELNTSNVKVIDLAVKYGYDSAVAFAAAFKRQHGVAPQRARISGVRLSLTPRLAFTISIRGDARMDVRILQRDGFRAIGKARHYTQETKSGIPDFWAECYSDGSEDELLRVGKAPLLGICYTSDDSGGFMYMIGLESRLDDNAPIPEGLSVVSIPKSTWAVFDCTGPMPAAMLQMWARIFTEFLPSDTYAHAGTPDMEVYDPGDGQQPDYHSEIWIPIVMKQG